VNILFRPLVLLCMLASTLFVGTASAAVKVSDEFDGAYYTPATAGRGVLTIFAPRPDGTHDFFGALFTFDNFGEPTWLILSAPFRENQFENTNVTISRVSGGEFGFPYDPGEIDEDPIGTATVRLNSCDSLYINLDFPASSSFDDVELGDLQPVDGPADTCVYRTEFEGCPAFSQASATVPRGCELNGVITQDVTLTNDTTWVLNGLVRVGNDNANSATLTIEPGTVLIGKGQASDYLYISPGSKIIANGTPKAPIVLTSPNDGFIEGTVPQPGNLGGLVVSGNAPSNSCPTAPFNCRSEFDETQRFGGDDPHDSSGEISYMQVRYAGFVFAANREVNSFTFQGVGDGTTVHHIQAYRGKDDGVEFFGGTVNVKYLVVTEGGDDAVDWDLGYSGHLQYGLVFNGVGFGEDFGIEGANNPQSFDALPRATPSVANFTFLGNGRGSSGIQFKQGSGGLIYNTIVAGYPGACIRWDNTPATYSAAGTPTDPNEDVSAFNGVIINCNNNFTDAAGSPYTVSSFFGSTAFLNNQQTNPQLDVHMPMPGSPALIDSVDITTSDFFDYTSYRGGFDGSNDWTIPWTFRPTAGQ